MDDSAARDESWLVSVGHVGETRLFRGDNMLSTHTRSMRNTRIERLWREVGSQFARRWKVFFQRLEDLYHLDASNRQHIWLLHRLFTNDLNEDCFTFRNNWNDHGVSGKLIQHKAPIVSPCTH